MTRLLTCVADQMASGSENLKGSFAVAKIRTSKGRRLECRQVAWFEWFSMKPFVQRVICERWSPSFHAKCLHGGGVIELWVINY